MGSMKLNIHIFILLWGIYDVYERWDIHSVALVDLESQIQPIEEKIVVETKKLKEIDGFNSEVR